MGHTECFEAFLKRVLWGNVPTHCPFHGLPPSGSGVLPFSCHISDAQRARLMGQLLCVANLEPRSVLGPFPDSDGGGWACRGGGVGTPCMQGSAPSYAAEGRALTLCLPLLRGCACGCVGTGGPRGLCHPHSVGLVLSEVEAVSCYALTCEYSHTHRHTPLHTDTGTHAPSCRLTYGQTLTSCTDYFSDFLDRCVFPKENGVWGPPAPRPQRQALGMRPGPRLHRDGEAG